MESSRKRIGWIDAVRAFAMFLIVLGHAFEAPSPLENWVYACHVPLFLLIGGLVFSPGDSFGRFFKKRFHSIVMPYFCFAVISILIYALIGGYVEDTVANGKIGFPLERNLIGMLWGNAKGNAMRWNRPLWFLPMYFTMELAGYWLLRDKSTRFLLLELVVSIAVAWIVYGRLGTRPNLPWDIETVLYLMPLFIAGRLLRDIWPAIQGARFSLRLSAGTILVILGAALVPLNGRVKYSADQFGNHYGLFLLIAFTLSIGIMLLFSLRKDGFPALNRVGQNTTGILVMHKFPIMFFAVVPFSRALSEAHPIVMPLIMSMISMGMCMIAIEALRRIAPWSIGVRRSR